nr:hypothetical protein [Candidatus Sigynarchaeota archaeon]
MDSNWLWIPPENAEQQLKGRAKDFFHWLQLLKEKLFYVAKNVQEEAFRFDIIKEYHEIKTNDSEFLYVPAGELDDALDKLKKKAPTRTRNFKFTLNMLFTSQAGTSSNELSILSDIAFFYRKNKEDTARDLDTISKSVVFQNEPMCVNIVDHVAPLFTLLIYQANIYENKFKFTLNPLKRENRIIDIVGMIASMLKEVHLEDLTGLLDQYDDVIITFLRFCKDNSYKPFYTADKPISGAPPPSQLHT